MGIVQFTILAKNDLMAIRDFIAQDKPKVASQYMRMLKEKMRATGKFAKAWRSKRGILRPLQIPN